MDPLCLWSGLIQTALSGPLCYLTALGHLSLIVLMARSGFWAPLIRGVTAVGQTALSNYILQTVLCSGIFYGFGMGLFGKLDRVDLLIPLTFVWAVEFGLSSLWLRHFHYGPAEWLWRSLTQMKLQPMRISLTSCVQPNAAQSAALCPR